MEIIISKSNSKIVEAKKLLQKKYRDKTNQFLVETKKVIGEAINSNLKPVCIFIEDGKENIFKNTTTYFVNRKVLSEITSTVSPDGYVAIFEKKQSTNKYEGGNFLILDCLQNPDNFGAIMRSALASDFKQIFVINCVDEYNSKTIRASMGNQFKLDIVHISYEDIPILFNNCNLYVADMAGDNLFKQNFMQNIGLVIGNEGNGVSEEILKHISNKISIPMENSVESLNASVSASIIMFYIYSHKFKV